MATTDGLSEHGKQQIIKAEHQERRWLSAITTVHPHLRIEKIFAAGSKSIVDALISSGVSDDDRFRFWAEIKLRDLSSTDGLDPIMNDSKRRSIINCVDGEDVHGAFFFFVCKRDLKVIVIDLASSTPTFRPFTWFDEVFGIERTKTVAEWPLSSASETYDLRALKANYMSCR